MNMMPTILRPALLGSLALALILSGCLNIKPVADNTRYFVLSSLPADDVMPPAASGLKAPALGLGLIVLPDYLKGNRLASRQDAQEIHYHEWLLWAEDLQDGVLRALGLNLSRLLSSRDIYLLDWDRATVDFEIHLQVFRFEPDDQGQAVLEAAWKITSPGGVGVVRSGTSRLQKNGPPVSEDPNGAVRTLSELLEQFSRELAGVLKELSNNPTPAK